MAEIRATQPDDLEAVHLLLAKRSRAAFGTSEQTIEQLQHLWELPGFDLSADSWVASESGQIVGYAELPSTHHLALAAVDPAVGDALLERAEARARERGFDHISSTAVPEDVPMHALVGRSGFAHDRDILRMWRRLDGDLPEPDWADGVTVRTYSDADGEAVHALLDASYAGWDPDYVARAHDDWLAFMTGDDEFDAKLWFLVERDRELVACSLHWAPNRGDGWVKDIVVVPAERGRGIGTALLHNAFRAYADRGAERIGLKVDSTNPTGAPRLYERLGFVIDRRYGIWTKRL